jgi:3-deoxy-D-manno-octulosonate 8-phosphate phosphatase (KDO 8-P phosphatase)
VKEMLLKLQGIRAFVFDWDGVFNSGEKNENGSSSFNEVDSMGINLLRFSHWLLHGELPLTAIISGERNNSSFHLSTREHFDSCYFKIPHKTEALNHLCASNNLKPNEVAFVFDDVLDLSMSKMCGFRILINRPGASLFRNYVVSQNLADYITGNLSGHYAIREGCELIMGLRGNCEKAMEERIAFSTEYQLYLKQRNEKETAFFTRQGDQIVSEKPQLFKI